MKFGIHIGHMGGPLAEMRKLWKFADDDRPSVERARRLWIGRRLARRRGESLRLRVSVDRPPRGHARGVRADHAPAPRPRIPIWIGGRGEKRTLRAAAKYADGWNGAYIGPDDWKHKSQVLDRWCETEGHDPKTIMRTVNLGFSLGDWEALEAFAAEIVRP